MANAFLERVAAVVSAIKQGIEEVSPDIEIDTSDSSAVEFAVYNVAAQELGVQFRDRRRKFYWYPMNPARAAEFAFTGSKGSWLHDRSFRVVNRNPYSGRFDGGKAIDAIRRRGRRSRASKFI